MNNFLGNLPPVVKNLLIINLVCFFGTMIYEPANQLFGVYYPDSPKFRIWQPITYMFMHGGFTHLLFNMLALVMVGSMLEGLFGAKRFLNYYLICALGALALQYGVQAVEVSQIMGTPLAKSLMTYSRDIAAYVPYNYNGMEIEDVRTAVGIYNTPMVGASGAIFGLLLALAYFYPNMPMYFMFVPIPIKAKYLVGAYLVYEIYSGFNNPGSSIAHLAHVGGALFGYILIKTWGYKKGYY